MFIIFPSGWNLMPFFVHKNYKFTVSRLREYETKRLQFYYLIYCMKFLKSLKSTSKYLKDPIKDYRSLIVEYLHCRDFNIGFSQNYWRHYTLLHSCGLLHLTSYFAFLLCIILPNILYGYGWNYGLWRNKISGGFLSIKYWQFGETLPLSSSLSKRSVLNILSLCFRTKKSPKEKNTNVCLSPMPKKIKISQYIHE